MQAAYDEVGSLHNGPVGLHPPAHGGCVQSAGADSKPIGWCSALAGLHIYEERQFSGRQMQDAQRRLGENKREWSKLDFPEDRGSMRVADILAAAPGESCDRRTMPQPVEDVRGASRDDSWALLGVRNRRRLTHFGVVKLVETTTGLTAGKVDSKRRHR